MTDVKWFELPVMIRHSFQRNEQNHFILGKNLFEVFFLFWRLTYCYVNNSQILEAVLRSPLTGSYCVFTPILSTMFFIF